MDILDYGYKSMIADIGANKVEALKKAIADLLRGEYKNTPFDTETLEKIKPILYDSDQKTEITKRAIWLIFTDSVKTNNPRYYNRLLKCLLGARTKDATIKSELEKLAKRVSAEMNADTLKNEFPDLLSKALSRQAYSAINAPYAREFDGQLRIMFIGLTNCKVTADAITRGYNAIANLFAERWTYNSLINRDGKKREFLEVLTTRAELLAYMGYTDDGGKQLKLLDEFVRYAIGNPEIPLLINYIRETKEVRISVFATTYIKRGFLFIGSRGKTIEQKFIDKGATADRANRLRFLAVIKDATNLDKMAIIERTFGLGKTEFVDRITLNNETITRRANFTKNDIEELNAKARRETSKHKGKYIDKINSYFADAYETGYILTPVKATTKAYHWQLNPDYIKHANRQLTNKFTGKELSEPNTTKSTHKK